VTPNRIQRGRPYTPAMRRLVCVALLLAVVGLAVGRHVAPVAQAAARDAVSILVGPPTSLDPAVESDVGSAFFSSQLFEPLTAFDLSLTLRPALARSWDIAGDGRRIIFHLRAGLVFSDGSSLTGADVVGSWLRVINPRAPSQLASLFMDVHGAADYMAGRTTDPANVGLSATGLDVTVDLDRPGADFPSIVASPTFGIVPPAVWRDGATVGLGTVASSGGYTVAGSSATEITLKANSHYWAGTPAIGTARLVLSIAGRSPVAAFEAGDVDYTDISSADAGWIAYDPVLGPQLRRVQALALSYLGFTTDRPPFNDVRVRQAFGAAVDWTRISTLAAGSDQVPAEGMVPPGIPGAGDGNFLPTHDPDLARRLLAEAGYPGGVGLPPIQFAAGGLGPAEAIAADLERELGVTIKLEEYDDHFGHLQTDPAPMWSLTWIADYPGANDFLGVLLGTGSTNNYGHWSSPAFDSAITDALATRDPAAAEGFTRALKAVRDDVPVVPLLNGGGWALSHGTLLGADENGLGILRLAGLAWK